MYAYSILAGNASRANRFLKHEKMKHTGKRNDSFCQKQLTILVLCLVVASSLPPLSGILAAISQRHRGLMPYLCFDQLR